jgi:hypothetical protein
VQIMAIHSMLSRTICLVNNSKTPYRKGIISPSTTQNVTSQNTSLPLFRRIQMPPKHLLPHALPIALNYIPMTRHNALKPPAINLSDTLIEPRAITRARAIPNRAFLPHGRPRRTLQRPKNLGQDPASRILARATKLLGRGQVEHHVGLDQCLCGFVVEHDFLVEVSGHVFPVKLGVEFRRDGGYGHVLFEDEGEGYGFVVLLFALLWKGFRAHDEGGRVGGVPGAEEDVVLERS